MHDPTGAELDEEERIERAEANVDHRQEVTSPDRVGVRGVSAEVQDAAGEPRMLGNKMPDTEAIIRARNWG